MNGSVMNSGLWRRMICCEGWLVMKGGLLRNVVCNEQVCHERAL